MGEVDLNFKSSVPTFDACVALGRRFNRYVRSDTLEGLITTMDRAGVDKALAYSPHAIDFATVEGNELLMQQIAGEPRVVPQFVGNPTYDDMDAFASQLHELAVRSVRMAPATHRYPFTDWVVGDWLEWLASENLPLWLDSKEFDPTQVHDTLKNHPDTPVVFSEVHYTQAAWSVPLLKSLPNTYIEISRFVVPDGYQKLIDKVGIDKVIFGSRFPDSSMAPPLYALHRMNLSDEDLQAVCSGNLERLLQGQR